MSTAEDFATPKSQKTFCRICEATCGLVVDFDATGTPTHFRPDREHPVSRGFACAKGTRYLHTLQSPERLQAPQWRALPGTDSMTVDWDRAMQAIKSRVGAIRERYGPHSVALYLGNPIAFNSLGAIAMHALQQSLGSRNVFTAGSQDCNNKFTGSYIVHGSPLVHPLPDFARTEFALLLGTNPVVSQSSFIHLEGGITALDGIKARGGDLVCVDPRRTESAKRWGAHLPIRPGTDVFLLLALLHEIAGRVETSHYDASLLALLALAADYPRERAAHLTGISAPDIAELAHKIMSRPSALHMSVGVNMGQFGTLAYVVLQAIIVLSGNLGRAGGSMLHPLAHTLARLMPGGGYGSPQAPRSRVGNYPAVLGSFPGGILADEILQPGEGQIRALICLAGDPLRSIPGGARLEQALRSLEFLVTIDTFESHTGKLAHLQLPALAWPERADVATTATMFQYSPYVQHTQPVLPGPAEARHDAAILAQISLALERPLFGSRLLAGAMARVADGRSMGHALRAASALLSGTRAVPDSSMLRMPTPRTITRPKKTAKAYTFWHSMLDGEPARLADFVTELQRLRAAGHFLVMGRRRKLGHNGWLHGGSRAGDDEAVAWMTPADAHSLGVIDGTTQIEIYNAAGSLRVPVKLSDDIYPGTVVVPHGLPQANLNCLIPSGATAGTIEPVSGMHQMQGIPVQVRLAA